MNSLPARLSCLQQGKQAMRLLFPRKMASWYYKESLYLLLSSLLPLAVAKKAR